MGRFLNPGNELFEDVIKSGIYVDKTGFISHINSLLNSDKKYICVSRPDGFGKSTAAAMVAAYYDRSCSSKSLFDGLEIASSSAYSTHLNKYPVIYIDFKLFKDNVDALFGKVVAELKNEYPRCVNESDENLSGLLSNINEMTGESFIVIIDDWDCIFRENTSDEKAVNEYINVLKSLFDGYRKYIKLAYLTGVLPIEKSLLNNFKSYTMLNPSMLTKYVGFTEDEVKALCDRYGMDFEYAKSWYAGYKLRRVKSVCKPKSVVEAMHNGVFESYATNNETLKSYIDMSFYGLDNDIITLFCGGRCAVNTKLFKNDVATLNGRDDVLTLLVHLGYLAYDSDTQEVFIPNREMYVEFKNAVEISGWENLVETIKASDKLLEATLDFNEKAVAKGITSAHDGVISVLNYNDEQALSCVITMAYYSASKYYRLVREIPNGTGFADMVFIPHKNVDMPAMVVEIKWDKKAESVISMLKNNRCIEIVEGYKENLVLVYVRYNKAKKRHSCTIEKYRE